MRKFITVFILFFMIVPSYKAWAKVYWIGRNIDFGGDTSIPAEDRSMVKIYGHSFIAVIPDNPEAVAKLIFPDNPEKYFNEVQRDFGNGYKGFIIAGYAEKGSKILLNMDGDLVAKINQEYEMKPARDYFAGRSYKAWGFSAGVVEYSDIDDAEAAANLYKMALYYQKQTETGRIDYNAVRSVLEGATLSEKLANNCNSLAFSLLAYTYASKIPDIGGKRIMPGNRKLLPSEFFIAPGIYDAERSPFHPRALDNDEDYENRMRQIRDFILTTSKDLDNINNNFFNPLAF